MRPRRGSKPHCSGCGTAAPGYDLLPMRRFEFIPIWGYRRDAALRHAARAVPRLRGQGRGGALGDRQAQPDQGLHAVSGALGAQAVVEGDGAELSHHLGKVCHAVEYVVQWGLEHRELGTLRAIGVDEIQYRAAATSILTLVYQIEAGCTRLLWVGKERTMRELRAVLHPDRPGTGRQDRVRLLGHVEALPGADRQSTAPTALNILDRFHIVAKMNKALDEVRAGEARRMAQEGYEPVLKKIPLVPAQAAREPDRQAAPQSARSAALQPARACAPTCSRRSSSSSGSTTRRPGPASSSTQWCTQAMRSRIEPMKKFARTVRAHRELLLNYFRARKQFSSGVIEGLNNKAKVTMRKAYGYRTFRIAELSLYHVLGKLPEPKLAHRFLLTNQEKRGVFGGHEPFLTSKKSLVGRSMRSRSRVIIPNSFCRAHSSDDWPPTCPYRTTQ